MTEIRRVPNPHLSEVGECVSQFVHDAINFQNSILGWLNSFQFPIVILCHLFAIKWQMSQNAYSASVSSLSLSNNHAIIFNTPLVGSKF